MPRKASLTLLLLVLACSPASAREWAEKMFETTSHDFGPVARGSKAEFEFPLNNVYLEDVHISSVRSSCGCTDVRIKQDSLKTYESGAIIATINTRSFLGSQGATVTVTFDKPFFAQVKLHTKVYIRSDVVFHPGSVDIGSVEQGQSVEKKISVNYTGKSDWEILEVKNANPHISGKVVQTRRNNGQVTYDLLVHLDENAPPGYIQDQLVLVTNDRHRTQVTVAVEGRIEPGITVSPASLFMGVVQPGQKVTKQLVVRGNKPFRITSVSCDDDSFEFENTSSTDAKPLHLIPVTFVAGEDPGKVLKTIRIETDLTDAVPELSVYAVVAP